MENRDGRRKLGDGRDGSEIRKRKMTVSDALKWAWGEELPKEPSGDFYAPPLAAASAWSSILRYGELGSIVDRQPNRFGCIPFDRVDFPHADALKLADAVHALAECAVDVPAGWHPMPELAEIDAGLAGRMVSEALERATVTTEAGERFYRSRPDMLVVRHAILGVVPDWRLAHSPLMKFERWPNGRHRWFARRDVRTVIGQNADGSDKIAVQTTEVDGWSSRLQRPVAGAYRRPYFEPDPVPVMVARADYEIFCAAMGMLFGQLAGALETIDLVAVDWLPQPWADSPAVATDSRRSRILPDLRRQAPRSPARKMARKSTRKTAAKAGANPA